MYFQVGGRAPHRGRTGKSMRLLAPLMALSCAGGTTCGEEPGSGGYEYAGAIQPDVGRVRITQDFLDFIRPQLSKAIRAALSAPVDGSDTGNAGDAGNGASSGDITIDDDNVLHLKIPDAELLDIGVAKADLRNAEAYLWMSELADKLELTFEEPSSVRVKFSNLRLGLALTLKEEALGADSACPVFSELGPDGPGPLPHAALIDVEAFITAGVGPDPARNLDVRVTVDGIDINDLALEVADASVYCDEPECQDCALEIGSTCSDPGGRCAECVTFCGAITDATLTLASSLIDIIAPLIQGFVTTTVERVVDQALAGLNATPAKVETQASLASAAGLPTPPTTHPLGFFVGLEPGDFPVIDRGTGLGMELPMAGGADGDASACVPIQDAFVPAQGPLPTLPATDQLGRPYHLGATLSASFLNQVLWAVERSGQLCMNLTTRDIFTLTDGGFILNASILSLLAPELGKLATNEAPVMVELKPRHPGRIELGSSEVVGQDQDGNDVLDWMIKLSLEELGVAFHVRIHDRYVRVFEVTTDIFVGLSLQALADDDRLEVSVGEIRIDNFEENFNEILHGTDFAQLLPTIIDLALGAVLNDEIKLDLDLDDALSSVFPGDTFGLRVNEIYRDGLENDHLTMTLTVTTSTESTSQLKSGLRSGLISQSTSKPSANASSSSSSSASDRANLGVDPAHPHTPRVTYDPTRSGLVVPAKFGTGARGLSTGHLSLNIPSTQASESETSTDDTDGAREAIRLYQVRVDHGVWRHPRPLQPTGAFTSTLPVLRVPGHHTVDVRTVHIEGDGRRVADPRPASFDVFVDLTPPEVTSHPSPDGVSLVLEVSDNEPEPDALTLLGRTPGEETWFEIPMTQATTPRYPSVEDTRVSDAERGDTNSDSANSDGAGTVRQAILDVSTLGAGAPLEIVAVDASGNTSAIQHVRRSITGTTLARASSTQTSVASDDIPIEVGGCRCIDRRAAPVGAAVFLGLGAVLAGLVLLPRPRRRRPA